MATTGSPSIVNERAVPDRGAVTDLASFQGVVVDVLRQGAEQYLENVVRETISPVLRCRQVDVAHAVVEEATKAPVLERALRTAFERAHQTVSQWARPAPPGTFDSDGVQSVSDWSSSAVQPASSGTGRHRAGPRNSASWKRYLFRWRWLRPTPPQSAIDRSSSDVGRCSPTEKRALCEALSALALLDVCLMSTNVAVNRLLVERSLELITVAALSPICSGDRGMPLEGSASTAPISASLVPFEYQVYVVRARQYLMHWARVMEPLAAEFPEFQRAAVTIERRGLVLILRYRHGARTSALTQNASTPYQGAVARSATAPTSSVGTTQAGQSCTTNNFYQATSWAPRPWSWLQPMVGFTGVCYHYGYRPTPYVVVTPAAQPNHREQMLQRLRAEFRETREAIELLAATTASLREDSPNELPELETIANASHLYERVRLMRDGLASLVPRIVEPTLREEAARLRSDAERVLSAFDVLCETNAVLGAALRQGNASSVPDRQGDSAENTPQRVAPNDSAASTVCRSSLSELNVVTVPAPSAPTAEQLIESMSSAAPMEASQPTPRREVTAAHLIDDDDEIAHDTALHPVLQPHRLNRRCDHESPRDPESSKDV